MTPLEIQIGTRLELELLNENQERVGQIYVSQLHEVQENGAMVISAPIHEARLVFIPSSRIIRLAFIHIEHGLLGFNATVTANDFRNKIAVLIVQPETELYKMQRRKYYRLDFIKDIAVHVSGRKTNNKSRPNIRAFTKNISGCGLCIVTDTDIPKNSELEIELNLSENAIIKAKCEVVRNTWFEVMKSKSYELGLQFTQISKSDQNILIKFIYEQQRIRLRKETQ